MDGVGVSSVNTVVSRKSPPGETNFQTVPQIQRRGSTLPDAAKVTAKVAFVAGALLGTFNVILLSSCRNYIPMLYTDEQDVRDLAAAVLPVNAAFQLIDALAAQGNGVLKGLGRQSIGGYISLFAYYAVGYASALRPFDRS